MGVISRLNARLNALVVPPEPERAVTWPFPPGEFLNFGGRLYPLGLNQTLVGERIEPDPSFPAMVAMAYRANPVVAACEDLRLKMFSEARFQFRRRRNGVPGDLFGGPALDLLERPWPGAVTGDLLALALQHADFGGTGFFVRLSDAIVMARPDWVTIQLTDGGTGLGTRPAAYYFWPGGRYSGADPVYLDVGQVAPFNALRPDPIAPWRGVPWVESALPEILTDRGMTTWKSRLLENGATPNMVVTLNPTLAPQAFKDWVALMSDKSEGIRNAGRTMFLGAGATAQVVGANLQQTDFRAVQGAGEVRIANAAGVPATVVGLSEGLQGSSLNTGNYGMAMRRFADLTMRPLWRNVAGALAQIIAVPGGAELWYDDRHIDALRQDAKDAAEIAQIKATTIRTYLDAGYEPASVVKAVDNDDRSLLVHTGLYSVQLQPPMPERPAEPKPEPPPEEGPANE